MIVINQRRQQPSKECALLMGELLRPGDTSKRALEILAQKIVEPSHFFIQPESPRSL